MEKLYEDKVDDKIVATAKISQLFRNADYLEELLSHDALLGVRPRRLPACLQRGRAHPAAIRRAHRPTASHCCAWGCCTHRTTNGHGL